MVPVAAQPLRISPRRPVIGVRCRQGQAGMRAAIDEEGRHVIHVRQPAERRCCVVVRGELCELIIACRFLESGSGPRADPSQCCGVRPNSVDAHAAGPGGPARRVLPGTAATVTVMVTVTGRTTRRRRPGDQHNEEKMKDRIYRATHGAAEYRSHEDHCIVRCRLRISTEARDPCRLRLWSALADSDAGPGLRTTWQRPGFTSNSSSRKSAKI